MKRNYEPRASHHRSQKQDDKVLHPITRDLTRVMVRIKALYRSRAIPCAGQQAYAVRRRAEWWQRGTNENTNRLLRQYLPKRTDLSGYTQSEPDKIALRLNQGPRKTLSFQIPASKLRASVAPPP